MTEDVESYCDNKKPPLVRSISQIQIIFMTDRYVQRTGFQFKYFLNSKLPDHFSIQLIKLYRES